MAKLPKTFTGPDQVTENIRVIVRVMSSYPNSMDSVTLRVAFLETAIELGVTNLGVLYRIAVEVNGFAFVGSGAGMRKLDSLWTAFLNRFPTTVEDDEIAAHITNDLIDAR